MALKYTCKWCGTGTASQAMLCFNCREKLSIITGSGVFDAKGTNKTTWEREGNLNVYAHELGSETKKLIDFVNKSGTIHYGRVVAQERMGVR